MEIMEFCQKVKRSMNTYAGEEVTVSVKQITKNNGVVLHSIIVNEKERNISPNIYLDDLYEAYESGETFRDIMEQIVHIYEESRMKKNIDMSFFLNYDCMKGKVVYKVIGYEKNKELLCQIPHIPFLDMAIVFYCHVPEKEIGGSATILIYNNHLKMWKVSKEQLYQDALKNTEKILPAQMLSAEDMMREILMNEKCGKSPEEAAAADKDSRMYVLSNGKKLFGAAVMLYPGVLEQFAEGIGRNLFVLPSSVHEVILVPDDEKQESEELWKMVCEINATKVEPEEVLTDSVYYFSRKCKKIEKLF